MKDLFFQFFLCLFPVGFLLAIASVISGNSSLGTLGLASLVTGFAPFIWMLLKEDSRQRFFGIALIVFTDAILLGHFFGYSWATAIAKFLFRG